MTGKATRPFTVELCVEGTTLMFEVDTGAAVTLVSEETYKRHFPSKTLQRSSMRLKTYTEEQVQVLGQIVVDVCYGIQKGPYVLYVVKGVGSSLLGRDWLRHIRLDWRSVAQTVANIKSVCHLPLLERYSEVFNDQLGKFKTGKAHLEVQPKAVPKFCKPRPVPLALKETLERELSRLEELGILERVIHSEWAAPVVVVP